MKSNNESNLNEIDFNIINEAIVKELSRDEIYLKHISLKNNKDYCSLKAMSNLALRISYKKGRYLIEFKPKYSKYFLHFQIENKNDGYCCITFQSVDEIASIASNLCSVAIDILSENCGESFGCCSRYLECSNEKKCIHPDKVFAISCEYRRNLENGKIFYGKNRNV